MSSYIDHKAWGILREHSAPEVIHSWQQFTERRLLWLYGPERAQAIISGQDHATQADLASWRSLGQRSAA